MDRSVAAKRQESEKGRRLSVGLRDNVVVVVGRSSRESRESTKDEGEDRRECVCACVCCRRGQSKVLKRDY